MANNKRTQKPGNGQQPTVRADYNPTQTLFPDMQKQSNPMVDQSRGVRQFGLSEIYDADFSTSTTKRRGAGGRASIRRSAVEFLTANKNTYAPLTKEALMRRYILIDKEMELLYKQGLMSSLSPKNMTPEDIKVFICFRQDKDVSPSEMSHMIAALSTLFRFIGSDAVETCMVRYPHLKPVISRNPLPSMESDVYDLIFESAALVDDEDWQKMRAYAVVILCLSAGLRSKELRLCNVNDIECRPDCWLVKVMHPKGEDKYAKPRKTYIDPIAYPFLARYLQARSEYVNANGIQSLALIPGGLLEGGYFASNTIRSMKALVEKDIGKNFDLRQCRRTYGQRLIDNGVGVESVSKMLGHKNTVTTENCYCGLREDDAISTISSIYKSKNDLCDASPALNTGFARRTKNRTYGGQ